MRVRIARPTQRLDEHAAFYEGLLGLPRVAAFQGHEAYDGIVLAAGTTEIEFTRRDHAPPPPPTHDAHLVLAYDDPHAHARALDRLHEAGAREAIPANPWWRTRGRTFLDPDDWEVVLVPPGRAPPGPES